ncbi:phosphoglucosamine mutase [Buchnera aphidicola]|uniref:Phosphoglucosamine mutase n=1 Tax=Buchnera aphidicola str. USDA (Myzus persicae) TaxID=1009856 RepID=W0P4J9_BUCMP|nr:phosphoglucosamine mutase [Buchnera aphidicola]AHG60008.1 Mrsa [Buchnera aphidicola str. USDA (Myzus persicae)]AHG60588.1 Mrsa [Buchnera aphidicola str. W106 (Myzus persicae)]AHG61161.1 Mrsa [Buchnera aphidicola str. G002 (Myzus persicae)]AHG61733.1 Mrsa [Buchnera aphidicola str. F009 (Myzus persicae)]WAI03307.1 MAG: phosphoglucosamine mutase [Buchnera aphidicola (Myzus persicae)]
MHDLQYFKTDGIRGKVGKKPITPEFFLKLGWSIGTVLGKNKTKKIIIGRDTRISGTMLQSALEYGILSTGTSTLLADCVPTSAIAYFTRFLNASAGIVISGSHNLFDDNGIKVFYKHGIKLDKEIECSIEKNIKKNVFFSNFIHFGLSHQMIDAEKKYINFCINTFPKNLNLSKLTIVLDCANGATYRVAPKIFRNLGAKIINFSINPNGVNINKNSGSTNVLKLKKKVLLEKADIGLAFDGDGDRVIMIDHLGHEIDGDQIIYIIAKEYLKNRMLNGGVVGTLMTNMGVVLSLKKLGIPFFAAPIGDSNVYRKIQEKKWILGAEKSGHVILSDKHSTGDGIIASLQVLLSMINNNKTLYQLSKEVKLFPQILLNVFSKKEINLAEDLTIQNILAKSKSILGQNSRILLRKSGTESCIRIMVEGKNFLKVHKLAHDIAKTIELL